MSTPATLGDEATSSDTSTRHRLALLGIVLTITSIAAIPVGVLWPEPESGGDLYAYSDIEPIRAFWWGLLTFGSAMLVLNVPLQALVTMALVRRRGWVWATVGAAMMWIGTGLYAAGASAWAAAYYFPTDPSVDPSAGRAVFDAIEADSAHVFATLIPGALLVALGTVVQVVGLFRARAVPIWIPIFALMVVPTFIVPGNGLIGVITAAPMAAAAIGLAYYAWRRA